MSERILKHLCVEFIMRRIGKKEILRVFSSEELLSSEVEVIIEQVRFWRANPAALLERLKGESLARLSYIAERILLAEPAGEKVAP